MSEIKLAAEVSGTLVAVSVGVGSSVEEGDELAVIESMKMEIPVVSTASGIVENILNKPGDMVEEGHILFFIRRRPTTT